MDIASSLRFASYKIGKCPCITRSRASHFGYWSTTSGRLTVEDLMVLQGFPKDSLSWREVGMSDGSFAAALGNSMSLNVILALLPHALYMSRMISESQFIDMATVRLF